MFLYLETFSDVHADNFCIAPVETVICLFTCQYSEWPKLGKTFVKTNNVKNRTGFKVKITDFYIETNDECELQGINNYCKLPFLLSYDGGSTVAGLCAVLRQILKKLNPKHPLLGFKQSCLYACAEVSLFTKFCEVDMVNVVNDICGRQQWKPERFEIPRDMARFEVHMSQPVRVHNKQKHIQMASAGRRKNTTVELYHDYVEGHQMTLADVILFPSFHLILQMVGGMLLKFLLPLTYKWYDTMRSDNKIERDLEIFLDLENKFAKERYVNYIVPIVESLTLYKRQGTKSFQRRQAYTHQEDIVECLEKVYEEIELFKMSEETFGKEIDFDWKTVPMNEGQIPVKRLERKGQQLENMTKAVLKIAKQGDVIVDFCTGSGHLGLILAHALPRCSLILLENKEQSLTRAIEQAAKLKLSNVSFVQGNVDYFKGRFDIGVSLHACGVATDLVMELCFQQNAAFVCCPCCYGFIKQNHMVTYPRSEIFRKSSLTLEEYFILGHASDQTHDEDHYMTNQGNECMAIIDSDRCLKAKELGYVVVFSKLDPPSCTPKNNLLVGAPEASGRIREICQD